MHGSNDILLEFVLYFDFHWQVRKTLRLFSCNWRNYILIWLINFTSGFPNNICVSVMYEIKEEPKYKDAKWMGQMLLLFNFHSATAYWIEILLFLTPTDYKIYCLSINALIYMWQFYVTFYITINFYLIIYSSMTSWTHRPQVGISLLVMIH